MKKDVKGSEGCGEGEAGREGGRDGGTDRGGRHKRIVALNASGGIYCY